MGETPKDQERKGESIVMTGGNVKSMIMIGLVVQRDRPNSAFSINRLLD